MKLEERSLENLENLYNTNLERLQSVQLELGNKRLFYPDGSEMDIAAFSYARRKLKEEMMKLQSISSRLKQHIKAKRKEENEALSFEKAIQYGLDATSPNDLIRASLGLLRKIAFQLGGLEENEYAVLNGLEFYVRKHNLGH